MSWGDGDILALSANNVQMGRIDESKEAYRGSNALYQKWMTKGDCALGDVLLTTEAPLGNVAQVPDTAKYILSQRVLLIRPQTWISKDFFAHYLRSTAFQGQLDSNSSGSTAKGIQRARLEQLPIALPPLTEQQTIAEALSDAEALIESLSLLLAKKRKIKQGAMQELLTGKKRLSGFTARAPQNDSEYPIDWQRYLISQVADVKTGPFGSALHEKDYVRSGTPIITVEHIGEYGIDAEGAPQVSSFDAKRLQAYTLEAGDIVFSRVGSIDRSAMVRATEEGWLFSGRLLRLRVCSPAASPTFLGYLFHTERFKQQVLSVAVGQTMASLNTRILNSLEVSLPSLHEQESIAQVLVDMDADLIHVASRLAKARALKQGMMQALLTGRMRLVKPTSKIILLPTKPTANLRPNRPTHNWQINEAVVIGMLAKHFGSEQFPLPRKRRVKLTYLLHRHAEGRAEGYLKKAAGPYDPNTKYKGPEQIALKNGYVRALGNGTYEGFIAGDKIEQAQRYFEQWYGAATLDWLERFHYRKTDDLELLATVDMAMMDLAANGERAELTSVKRIIAAHPEWLPKLSRELFSDERIASAIAECQALFGG